MTTRMLGVTLVCALSALAGCSAATKDESVTAQDALSSDDGDGLDDAPDDQADDGVVVFEGDPQDAAASEDDKENKGASQPSPFCLNIAKSIQHIAKNHVFGIQNLAGHTRKPGDGDRILTRFAKTNVSGWHGAWDSTADAEQAIDEAFVISCGKLVQFADVGAVGATTKLRAKTSVRALTCSAAGECLNTYAVELVLKKTVDYIDPVTRSRHVEVNANTAYPWVNR